MFNSYKIIKLVLLISILSIPLAVQAQPTGKIRYTTFQRNQVLQWEKRYIDGMECLVSPVINHGRKSELNHHTVTINYSGRGRLKLSLMHSTTSKFDYVLSKKKFRTRFSYIRSDNPQRIISSQKGEKYAWIIIGREGEVQVNSIRHSCWVGENTLYGHMPAEFEYKGATLKFRLMLPRDYNPKKSYPLVISVGGSGGIGDDNRRSMEDGIFSRYAFTKYYYSEQFQCFSIVPQIPPAKLVPAPFYPKGPNGAPDIFHPDWPVVNENGWYTQATLELVRSFIKTQSFNIDPNRVYYTGFSYGGKTCWEFLKAGRDIFAGAICVGGWPIGRCYSNPSGRNFERLKLEVQRYKHIPVWIFAGQLDNMKFGSKAVYNELLRQGAKSRYIEFPNAKHGISAHSALINRRYIEWLFLQNKSKNPEPGPDPFPKGVYTE